MKCAFRVIIFLLAAVSVVAVAQTGKQRGVVRLITTSASSPLTPVAGVKVQVGNNISNATGSNGAFTIKVSRQFSVNGVIPSDQYILAHPTKGKTYTQSPNDIEVIITSAKKRKANSDAVHQRNVEAYNRQTKELEKTKKNLEETLTTLKNLGADYKSVEQELKNVSEMYLRAINDFDKIDEEFRRIADELSLIDYITADTLTQKYYDYASRGEFKLIKDFLLKSMNNDPYGEWERIKSEIEVSDSHLEQVKQEYVIAKAENERSLQEKEKWLFKMEKLIEASKTIHENDSVSKYYQILTDAAPDNWDYLNYAGLFEHDYMANCSKAMDYYQRALSTNPADTLLATSYNNIGYVYSSQGDYGKALEYYENALKIRLTIFGENHPDVATSYNNIGGVYDSQGDCGKALEYYENALKIKLAIFGENHPDVATSYNNIGYVYSSQGDYGKALEYYENALKIRLTIFGENHPDVATSYNNIGSVYYSQGDYEKALEYIGKVLKILLTAFGENHPYVANSYNSIGSVYYLQGDYGKALEYMEKALKIFLNFFPEDHPNIRTVKESIDFLKTKIQQQ